MIKIWKRKCLIDTGCLISGQPRFPSCNHALKNMFHANQVAKQTIVVKVFVV